MPDETLDIQPGGAPEKEAPRGAMFHCAACGHGMALPESMLGRAAKCPKCGELGTVALPDGTLPPPVPVREPNENDVRLDDLVQEGGSMGSAKAAPVLETGPLSVEGRERQPSAGEQLRGFFAGNPALNLLSGLLGAGHLGLHCLALTTLFLALPSGQATFGHILPAMLLPAVLGSVLFALSGRMRVALGAPDPAATLCVFLLLYALAGDMLGHVTPRVMGATLLAALSVVTLMSGLVAVLFSRLGAGQRVRYLPPEAVGGLLAGFGLLLVRHWFDLVAAGNEQLLLLAAGQAQDVAAALASSSGHWGPVVGFGLLAFVLQIATRNILWPLLASALAIAAWNFGPAHIPALKPYLAQQAPLALKGDLAQLTAHLDLPFLHAIDWHALWERADFFVACALLAVVPSLLRISILEPAQGREADPDGQAQMLGAANMLSGALGGLPSSLSLSSSLGLRSLGAAGPLAGFVAGLACLGLAATGGRWLPFVPGFVPLGLLLAIGLAMPVSWLLRDGRNALTDRHDVRLSWTICGLTVVFGPVLGVLGCLGLGLAVSLMRSVADGGLRFRQKGDVFHSNVDRSPEQRRALREQGGRILVLRLRGYLFLGTLSALGRTIQYKDMTCGGLKYVLLDFGAVTGLGASASLGFKRLEQIARDCGFIVFLTSVPLEMEEHMEALGYRMDGDGVCRVALNLDYALEWCEDRILDEAGLLDNHEDSLEGMLSGTFPEPRLVPLLMKCLERVEVARKKAVFHQGEPSDSMYFLQSGKVHVELTLPGGKVLRLKKMGPGTVFGEMGLYTSAPRSATVLAMEKCVLYRLSVARFALIQEKAPQLAAAVNRYIVALLADRVAEENAKNRANQA